MGHSGDDARPRPLGELVLACAGGDRAALRRLYALSSPKVFGVLVAMLGDREAAAEVAQEVYVAVWRNAAAFRPEAGSAVAWLMTIARNRAIDRLRAARAGASPVDDPPDLAAETPPVEAPALDALGPEARRALSLVLFGGYTYEEVARALEVPIDTAKAWVRRGLAALREERR